MKSISAAISAAAIIALTASCNIKSTNHYEFEDLTTVTVVRDTTIYGICGSASTATRLQLITDSEDTVYIDVDDARKAGKVMPDYKLGSNLCVITDTTRTRALMVINKDCLLGEWVIPSPYDGSTPSGIVIKDNGDAESFGQQGDIVYKSWRIFNGQLQIVETRDDDTDIYTTHTYDIVRVTPDSLYLSNANEDETFEFGRFVPEPEEDLGITFDDEDNDAYMINW